MVTGKDLQAWASGRLSNSATDEELGGGDEASTLPPDDEEETDPGSRNLLWAGEYDGTLEALPPEDAVGLVEFLQATEPEIADAVFELADAAATDDDAMLQHGTEELLAAAQQDRSYPELDEAQRQEIATLVAEQIRTAGGPERDSPEWQQAIAVGIATARAGDAGELDEDPELEEEDGDAFGGGGDDVE